MKVSSILLAIAFRRNGVSQARSSDQSALIKSAVVINRGVLKVMVHENEGSIVSTVGNRFEAHACVLCAAHCSELAKLRNRCCEG